METQTSHPLLQGLINELEKLLHEKSELDERKRVVDARVDALLGAAEAVQRVYGGEIPQNIKELYDAMGVMGITDHVRAVLNGRAGHWTAPTEVKSFLEQRGVDLSNYSNPMAMIHQILKRLEGQGELTTHPGVKHYMLKTK